jgi:hypothetical protein
MNKLMLTMVVGALFAQGAQAADVPTDAMPAAMPAYAKDKPLPVPHIGKKMLSNGLQVWIVPRNGVPRVDMVLAVRDAGLAADDADHPGFASLLAGLLNEGTAKRDSRAIAEAAQGLGGSVGGSAGVDGITVSANALASQAGPMMQLLAEVVRTPSFPPGEVALAKANALQSLRVSETQPRFRAERAINRAIYGDHPYGHTTPTVESIESTTEALLRGEHAKRFRPERALLVITGRIKEADALKLAPRSDHRETRTPAAGTGRQRAVDDPPGQPRHRRDRRRPDPGTPGQHDPGRRLLEPREHQAARGKGLYVRRLGRRAPAARRRQHRRRRGRAQRGHRRRADGILQRVQAHRRRPRVAR